MNSRMTAAPSNNGTGIEYAWASDVGMRRANNQDSYAAVVAGTPERFQKVGHLFVVADGMGAHAAGELASRIATEKIPHYYLRSNGHSTGQSLQQAVISANNDIHRRGQENPEFHNMGTTASSLVLKPEGAIVAHVGDSRVYRLRGDSFEQLTFDHSLVWEMQAAGQVRPGSELSDAIPKNVITRSLGPNSEVAVDLEGPMPLQKGDVFLLCSDGLSGQVTDDEMGTLVRALEPELAVRVLVDLANLRGGPDNITVIVVKVTDGQGNVSVASNRPAPAGEVNWPLVVLCATALSVSVFMATLSNWPLAAITAILAVIFGVVAALRYMKPHAAHLEPVKLGNPRSATSPYRRASAKPSAEQVNHLISTIGQIRRAAAQQKWRIDWRAVDNFEQNAARAMRAGNLMEALRAEAQGVIETMAQLRDQQSRGMGDTTIDF